MLISSSLIRQFKFILLFSAAIIGCSCTHNKPKAPEINDILKTHIDEQDTKKFSYQLTIEKPEKQSKGNKGGGPGGKGGSGGGPGGKGGDRPRPGDENEDGESNRNEHQNQKIVQLIDENLTKIFNHTGYCREGYNVIDQEIRKHAAIVNGECIDKANSSDKELFPNAQTAPMIIIEEDLGSIH